MRILVVCSGNSKSPFILDQAESLKQNGLIIDYFYIMGKGIPGYLKNMGGLKNKVSQFQPDLIHAHFGLSGLLANLQRKVPVVTTYHGCDINKYSLRLLSLFSIALSSFNIFVSFNQYKKVRNISKKKYILIPCGINRNDFYPVDKIQARKQMNLELDKKYILFSSSFSIPVKNYKLASEAVSLLDDEVELIELDGYSRKQVNLLMNACDVGLLTSVREGSPMFVKELLATNTPIVSTDVGDVKERIKGVSGCYIAESNARDIANKLMIAFSCGKTNGIDKVKEFDNDTISKKIIGVYNSILIKN